MRRGASRAHPYPARPPTHLADLSSRSGRSGVAGVAATAAAGCQAHVTASRQARPGSGRLPARTGGTGELLWRVCGVNHTPSSSLSSSSSSAPPIPPIPPNFCGADAARAQVSRALRCAREGGQGRRRAVRQRGTRCCSREGGAARGSAGAEARRKIRELAHVEAVVPANSCRRGGGTGHITQRPVAARARCSGCKAASEAAHARCCSPPRP